MKSSRLAAGILAALPVLATVEIPAGTELSIRLGTKVSSSSSKPKDPVQAQLIVPVMAGGEFVIPAGAKLRGVVEDVKAATKPDERASLVLNFNELEFAGSKLKLEAVLAAVDNARESVDDKGRVQGILASETISARLDSAINKVAERYSGLAGVLEGVKGGFMGATQADITFEPGVEMQLKLSKPLQVPTPGGPGPVANLGPVSDPAALDSLVTKLPYQTMAQSPSKPSDITNLLFIGPEDKLRQAFQKAGWSEAAALSTASKLETMRAISEMRGYKEAPVSILLLDKQPPDMVWEKLNNTFAQRHHLRIWRRPETYQGEPVWTCAATHDTGIDFSAENRTFIHKIDSQIDKERAKVVNDLLLTGMIRSLALVDRPAVPRSSENATGDKLVTDGHQAVLILN